MSCKPCTYILYQFFPLKFPLNVPVNLSAQCKHGFCDLNSEMAFVCGVQSVPGDAMGRLGLPPPALTQALLARVMDAEGYVGGIEEYTTSGNGSASNSKTLHFPVFHQQKTRNVHACKIVWLCIVYVHSKVLAYVIAQSI
eukprot:COSAG05_NODE_40_length_27088_cov_92.858276_5_plen_140_part_00